MLRFCATSGSILEAVEIGIPVVKVIVIVIIVIVVVVLDKKLLSIRFIV